MSVQHNPKLPLTSTTNASYTEIRAIILNILPNKSELLIVFAFRLLIKIEMNYSQIDKEAMEIVWRFNNFLYCSGREIILITDNKPLTRILHSEKDLPITSAIRHLYYANFMAEFEYIIQCKSTKWHEHSNYLSRFSLYKNKKRTT